MRILIDTNIFIELEGQSVIRDSCLSLLKSLEDSDHKVLVHPSSVDDLQRDSNLARQQSNLSKVGKYPLLERPPECSDEFSNQFGLIARNDNDRVDLELLCAVFRNSVHILISEDQKLHSKAKLLGISNRVFYAVDNMELFNAFLKESERDISFYEDLIADPLSKNAAALICLGAILFRLEKGGRADEIRLYAFAFVDRLEHVVTNKPANDKSKLISSRLPHIRNACIHAAVYLGDSDLAARAVQNLLLYCPYPSLYFEVKLLADEYGEIVQVPLELAFNQFSVLDKLRIIVSGCLAQTDPEDLISIGAPRDEYSPEADALIPLLSPDISVEELTAILYEIWRTKFGQYWKSNDGQLIGPYDSPDYKAPDLSQSAHRICEAIQPYLLFLQGQ